MSLFKDHTYTEAFTSAPTIKLGDQIYVQIQVTEPEDFFHLKVNECWATQTPQANKSSFSHTLLINGLVLWISCLYILNPNVSFLRSVTTNTHSWQFIGIMFLMNWWLNVQKLGWNFAGKEGPLPISNSVAMHQVHNGNIFGESLQWKAMRCTHSNLSAVCYSTENLCNLLEQVTFVWGISLPASETHDRVDSCLNYRLLPAIFCRTKKSVNPFTQESLSN